MSRNDEKKRKRRKKRQAQSPLGRWARNKQTADYLSVTVMTLWRWKHDQSLNFPPAHIINGIEYNDLDAVDGWVCARPVRCAVAEEAAAMI
jgi:hypothetical protein